MLQREWNQKSQIEFSSHWKGTIGSDYHRPHISPNRLVNLCFVFWLHVWCFELGKPSAQSRVKSSLFSTKLDSQSIFSLPDREQSCISKWSFWVPIACLLGNVPIAIAKVIAYIILEPRGTNANDRTNQDLWKRPSGFIHVPHHLPCTNILNISLTNSTIFAIVGKLAGLTNSGETVRSLSNTQHTIGLVIGYCGRSIYSPRKFGPNRNSFICTCILQRKVQRLVYWSRSSLRVQYFAFHWKRSRLPVSPITWDDAGIIEILMFIAS